jgi:hypothetical protein
MIPDLLVDDVVVVDVWAFAPMVNKLFKRYTNLSPSVFKNSFN